MASLWAPRPADTSEGGRHRASSVAGVWFPPLGVSLQIGWEPAPEAESDSEWRGNSTRPRFPPCLPLFQHRCECFLGFPESRNDRAPQPPNRSPPSSLRFYFPITLQGASRLPCARLNPSVDLKSGTPGCKFYTDKMFLKF